MFRRLKTAIDAFYDRIMPAAWLRMKPRYQWAFGILIVGAGPVCSVPCRDDDVDAYLEGWDSLLDALVA